MGRGGPRASWGKMAARKARRAAGMWAGSRRCMLINTRRKLDGESSGQQTCAESCEFDTLRASTRMTKVDGDESFGPVSNQGSSPLLTRTKIDGAPQQSLWNV